MERVETNTGAEAEDKQNKLNTVLLLLKNHNAIGSLLVEINAIIAAFETDNDPDETISKLSDRGVNILVDYAHGQLRADMTMLCYLLEDNPIIELSDELAEIEQRRQCLIGLVNLTGAVNNAYRLYDKKMIESVIDSSCSYALFNKKTTETLLDYGLFELLDKDIIIEYSQREPTGYAIDDNRTLCAIYYLMVKDVQVETQSQIAAAA